MGQRRPGRRLGPVLPAPRLCLRHLSQSLQPDALIAEVTQTDPCSPVPRPLWLELGPGETVLLVPKEGAGRGRDGHVRANLRNHWASGESARSEAGGRVGSARRLILVADPLSLPAGTRHRSGKTPRLAAVPSA